MGLTFQSTGKSSFRELYNVKNNHNDYVIALAGNPNTGKSTLFNALTGLRQHTGNWPGKTVLKAQGNFTHKKEKYILVDLPGTYSLLSNSIEEELARDFLCFAKPDAIVVIIDANCIERNLNLLLQIMEISSKVVVCVNLIDEARRKNIRIDIERLGQKLGVPVIATAARNGEGLSVLKDTIYDVVNGNINPDPILVKYPPELEDKIAQIEAQISSMLGQENSRWISLRLIEGDQTIKGFLNNYQNIREVLV